MLGHAAVPEGDARLCLCGRGGGVLKSSLAHGVSSGALVFWCSAIYYSTGVLVSQWVDFDHVILLVFAVLMVALLVASEWHYTYGVW